MERSSRCADEWTAGGGGHTQETWPSHTAGGAGSAQETGPSYMEVGKCHVKKSRILSDKSREDIFFSFLIQKHGKMQSLCR